MGRKNSIISVSFKKAISDLLIKLAGQEHKSVARLVRELALEALEGREDYYLSKAGEKLDISDSKSFSHEEAWK